MGRQRGSHKIQMSNVLIILFASLLICENHVNGKITLAETGEELAIMQQTFALWGVMPGGTYENYSIQIFNDDDAIRNEYCNLMIEYDANGGIVPENITEELQSYRNSKTFIMMPGGWSTPSKPCGIDNWVGYTEFPCVFFGPETPLMELSSSIEGFGIFAFTHPGDAFAAMHARIGTNCGRFQVLKTDALMEAIEGNKTVNAVVDRNSWEKAFTNIITQILFRGLFPAFYFFCTFRAVRFWKLRYFSKKTKSKKIQYAVLILNAFIMSFIGIILAVDGYGITANINDKFRNGIRILFMGIGSGLDLFLAQLWDDVVQSSSMKKKIKSMSGTWSKVAAYCLISIDAIFFYVGYFFLGGFLGVMVVAVILGISQTVIGFRMWMATKKVLKLLKGSGTSTANDQSASARQQRDLIRRLAFWARVSVICSMTQFMVFTLVGLGILYFQSGVFFLLFNGIMIAARGFRGLAQIQFSAPPPPVKNYRNPGDATSVAPSSAAPSVAK